MAHKKRKGGLVAVVTYLRPGYHIVGKRNYIIPIRKKKKR